MLGAVALLGVLSALQGSLTAGARSVPSTYDTGASGYAALFAFLGREGVPVSRYERPLSALFQTRGVLVVAGDGMLVALASRQSDRRALDAWVRGGGTLAVAGATTLAGDVLDLPAGARIRADRAAAGCGLAEPLARSVVSADFSQAFAVRCDRNHLALLRAQGRAVAVALRRGNGRIVIVSAANAFDNAHLSRADNARFAYALFSHAGPVGFDERVYGYAEGKSFWQALPQSVRAAVVLACVVVLLAVAGANLPFAPPHEPREAGERDSSEYIASLAQMLERGGARRDVVLRLCASVSDLAAAARGEALAGLLAREASMLQAIPDPGAQDVHAAARLFARARKEYGS